MTDQQAWTLRDLARAALDANEGVSGRELDRRAKAQGLTISYTTINNMAAGSYTWKPSRSTLEALAKLAGVDAEVAFRTAGLPSPLASLADQLPPDADLLTGPQREAVIAVVRQFAAANREVHAAQRAQVVERTETLSALPDVEPDDDFDQDLEDQPADETPDPIYGEKPEQIAARKKQK